MKLLQQLIAIPSVSGSEQEIGQFIYDWFEGIGLKPVWVEENVAVKVEGKNLSQAVVFNAHVDTVAVGDEGQWECSPFAGKVKEGKMFGLGASDEKAGVAAIMLLAQKLVKQKPECDVWFSFVVLEEMDGSGTKEWMKWFMGGAGKGYKNLAGVLVEPTGLEEVELGHKGNVFIKLVVKGDSGHGSEPDKVKVHSVMVMMEVLKELQVLGQEWKKKWKNPVLGVPSIGLATSIVAGDQGSPNKFADLCEATCDVRTVPEMHDQVLELIKRKVKELPVEVRYLFDPAPYGLTEAGDPLVAAVKKVLPGVRKSLSKGSTDQCFFTQEGIPAVILGPGEKSCMHQPNEWCKVEKVEKAVGIYQKVVEEWSKLVQADGRL